MTMRSPPGPATNPSSVVMAVTISWRIGAPLGWAARRSWALTRTETAATVDSSPREQILRENRRQPERGHHRRVDEACDPGDPPGPQDQRVDGTEAQHAVRPALVAGEAGPVVDAHRDQPPGG